MKVLLVYPQYPETFWSFKYALKFIRKKAPFPPLGLLTVASMLPKEWDLKLTDMNIETLEDADILWADYVFLSAMSIQTASAKSVIERCHNFNKPVVAGGPLFTSSCESFPQVDHFVLNEAEITVPMFLSDLEKGQLKKFYTTQEWADITATPLPMWRLARMNKYSSMNIQYSRGCPFDCEFCDITVLYGRRPRTKTKEQVIAELDNLYEMGWRGPVFFVDDNFIGNKQKLKREILPAILDWLESHGHPFWFTTEASINLADDDELLKLMAAADFEAVFIGIETPNEESLLEAKKSQNRNRDLISNIKKIQNSGLEVQGGFIVGFDHDPPAIFDRLTAFIQESGVVTAMVGLLNAPKGTKLYNRLLKEGRLLGAFSGDNAFSINFIPRMNIETLMAGYKKVLDTIYSPKHYYARVLSFLKEFKPQQKHIFHFRSAYFTAFGKSIILMGVLGKERFYFWKLFFWSLFTRPRLFSLAIHLSIYGFHFRKVSTST
ncbi:MAG TPA: B12-binding domain-containing radical SAM protein [Ignavibacteriales bacterium]|nr:B12-binding domain-containing radical SAM protein [Ignavibacteriales bacterium]